MLGAGASYEFNAPLMKDFYNFAASLYVGKKSNERIRERFDTVFSFIDRLQKAQAKSNIDLHNIESVYTALEMAKLLGLEELKTKKSQSWSELDKSMKYFLSKVIESRVILPYNNTIPRLRSPSNDALSFIALRGQTKIAEALYECKQLINNNWDVKIITFNYDLVVEAILASMNMDVDYKLNPSESITENTEKVTLLKLHGSMNWYKKKIEKGGKISSKITAVPILNKTMSTDEKMKFFSVNGSGDIETRFSENLESIIVPPVWNKSSYHQEIKEIWREAALALSNASHIYCLGYSLPQTDGFFKQLFALGTVGFRPLQDFSVFDIEPKDKPQGVCNRYMEMLGRGSENVFTYHDDGSEGLKRRLKEINVE